MCKLISIPIRSFISNLGYNFHLQHSLFFMLYATYGCSVSTMRFILVSLSYGSPLITTIYGVPHRVSVLCIEAPRL